MMSATLIHSYGKTSNTGSHCPSCHVHFPLMDEVEHQEIVVPINPCVIINSKSIFDNLNPEKRYLYLPVF